MTLTQTQKRNLQIFKNELGYSRIEHLLSIYYEDQLRKEVSNIFQEMRYEVVKNLAEYYNPEIMVNAQMDLILAPIQEAHKKYYETLLKYKIREFDKSRQQGKRIVERMLNFKRKGNVLTKRFVVLKADINDAVSSTISKDKLFGTSDVAHDNLAQRTYQLSEGTLSRVDKDINQIITKGYDEGHGINTVSHNVTTRFNQLESWEAVRIARTEIHNSHSLGLIQGYDDMDVEYIQWSCSIDGRQRDSHELLHGEIIPLGGVFSNGLMYPGDMLGSAEEVINCRCQALPFIMPFGYIAPPGMAQFREDDLIATLDYFNADDIVTRAMEDSSQIDIPDWVNLNEKAIYTNLLQMKEADKINSLNALLSYEDREKYYGLILKRRKLIAAIENGTADLGVLKRELASINRQIFQFEKQLGYVDLDYFS